MKVQEYEKQLNQKDQEILDLKKSLTLACTKIDSYHTHMVTLNQKLYSQAHMLANFSTGDSVGGSSALSCFESQHSEVNFNLSESLSQIESKEKEIFDESKINTSSFSQDTFNLFSECLLDKDDEEFMRISERNLDFEIPKSGDSYSIKQSKPPQYKRTSGKRLRPESEPKLEGSPLSTNAGSLSQSKLDNMSPNARRKTIKCTFY